LKSCFWIANLTPFNLLALINCLGMSQDCHTSPPKPNANGGDTSSEDSDEHGVVASSEG